MLLFNIFTFLHTKVKIINNVALLRILVKPVKAILQERSSYSVRPTVLKVCRPHRTLYKNSCIKIFAGIQRL